MTTIDSTRLNSDPFVACWLALLNSSWPLPMDKPRSSSVSYPCRGVLLFSFIVASLFSKKLKAATTTTTEWNMKCLPSHYNWTDHSKAIIIIIIIVDACPPTQFEMTGRPVCWPTSKAIRRHIWNISDVTWPTMMNGQSVGRSVLTKTTIIVIAGQLYFWDGKKTWLAMSKPDGQQWSLPFRI